MTITRTTSGLGLPAGFPFSLASATDGVCFISGMPAIGADGTYAADTFTEETDLAWRNVTGIAEAAGYSAREIVYVQCVLADINDYGALNTWWRRQFTDPVLAPARFTFQAGALPFGAKIELQAIACRGE